ncbi:tRNA pseudouridine synthase-like 1 isoform X2 [Colletes gigas]|nr:tRNA pseudouridine synthase-like 1 isoform X2 [Colletes gigas]XP_043254120.1 tRNA pseudouridine synthase-like 1 isoform X2 [Colletes gigas]
MQKNVMRNNFMLQDPDTIQGALECAFSTLLPKCASWPKVTPSSRTDSGVHALYASAHVDLENKYDCIRNSNEVLMFVNRYLSKCDHDIRLLEVIPVTQKFHARYFAKSRTYIYRFMVAKDSNEQRIPIAERNRTHFLRTEYFDIEKIKCATSLFMGTKDFTTFCAQTKLKDRKIYVRSLQKLCVEDSQPFMLVDPLAQHFNYWNIICSSRSFLYNQVRRIVGSLLCLGMGVITEKDITTMLQVPTHKNWPGQIKLAPPHGLYLANVEYCQEELNEHTIKHEEIPLESKVVVPVM